MHRERRFSAWVQVSMGCNSKCLLHRPGRARPRAEPQARRDRRRADPACARRRATVTCSVRTSTRGSAISYRSSDRVRRAATRLRRGGGIARIRFTSPHRRTSAPGDRRDRGMRHGVRARPPAAPVGLVQGAQAMRRTYDRDRYLRLVDRLRAVPDLALGTDIIVGFPARRRRTSRRWRWSRGPLRQRLHVRLLAACRHGGGRDAGPGTPTTSSASASAARRRCRPGSRPSGTRSGSAASKKSSSKVRAVPTRRCCAAERVATRP